MRQMLGEFTVDRLIQEMWSIAFSLGHPHHDAILRDQILRRGGTEAAVGDILRISKGISAAMSVASPFLWRTELWTLAETAARAYQPRGDEIWHEDLFQSPLAYWGFETDLFIPPEIALGFQENGLGDWSADIESGHIQSYVWSVQTGKIVCAPIFAFDGFFLPVSMECGDIGQPVYTGNPMLMVSYAQHEWVKSPYVVRERQIASRAFRRRQPGEARVPEVNVIRLRPRLSVNKHGESEQRAWNHRWFVSGHWRQQPYPSLGITRPKWIAPYLKGPDDKPLMPVRPTVFAVVR